MSYDISLYRPDFLKRAIDSGLRDWTNADPIDQEAVNSAVNWLLKNHYRLESDHPKYGQQFTHSNSKLGIHVGVHPGSIAFSVAYWKGALDTIAKVKSDVMKLAQLTDLAIYDTQTGEIDLKSSGGSIRLQERPGRRFRPLVRLIRFLSRH